MVRVKLAYPKIPGSKDSPFDRCIAFERYDGTNLHWVWEAELGWYAFGTRRDRFDLDERGIAEFSTAHVGLEEAPQIFINDLAGSIDRVFAARQHYGCQEITVFTEFLGDRSFAGMHEPDDPKRLVLFDVEIAGKMLDPDIFIRDFSDVNIARVIYRGKLTGKFLEDVRQGKYDVAEGVVCKGKNRGSNNVWMVKVKTDRYMQKLQQAFANDWENYWE